MTQLQLSGITRSHILTTLAAAVPSVNLVYQWQKTGGRLQVAWWVLAGCAVVLVMPWVIRLIVRRLHRPRLDRAGIFVGDDAIPWQKITEAKIGRRGRRRYLILSRQGLPDVYIVLEDPYAGTLAPLAPLAQKLREHRPSDDATQKLDAMARGA